MAYNPRGLSSVESGLSGQRWSNWLLGGTDTPTQATAAGYIADASDRGLRIGDLVTIRQWTAQDNL